MLGMQLTQSGQSAHLGYPQFKEEYGDQSKTVMVLFLYLKNRRENMTENEVEVKLAEHGKEIGSLKHRMKEAEDVVSVVHQLAQEMVGLTKEVGFMNQTLVQLTAKVTHLEQTPAKRWDGVVTALIGAVIGAVVAMYL
nr:MAG TPA: Protein of unknown function (DUF1515) [Bacteriophage sp.]